eukprot:28412-Hanusia_phi.AAC.11
MAEYPPKEFPARITCLLEEAGRMTSLMKSQICAAQTWPPHTLNCATGNQHQHHQHQQQQQIDSWQDRNSQTHPSGNVRLIRKPKPEEVYRVHRPVNSKLLHIVSPVLPSATRHFSHTEHHTRHLNRCPEAMNEEDRALLALGVDASIPANSHTSPPASCLGSPNPHRPPVPKLALPPLSMQRQRRASIRLDEAFKKGRDAPSVPAARCSSCPPPTSLRTLRTSDQPETKSFHSSAFLAYPHRYIR